MISCVATMLKTLVYHENNRLCGISSCVNLDLDTQNFGAEYIGYILVGLFLDSDNFGTMGIMVL